METEYAITEEFSAPQIRERLRRAYRRLAKEAQKRANNRAIAPVAASSSADEERVRAEEQQHTYIQQRLF